MFKETFKYYKSKNPQPNFDKVLDFNTTQKICSKIKKVPAKDVQELSGYGLTSPSHWEAYELIDHPGLIFIRNPFTAIGQRYWSVRCLQDYTKKPNKSNLDPFKLITENEEWWDITQRNKDKVLMKKLRWVTLGYHHDWNTKIYTEENKGEFPEDLAELSKLVANCFGYNFNAEAAIVNFYHLDSTLSGHTDHSEQNLEAPLLSFSFGQTAIFLLGGTTKDDATSAMFLRSGDIVIMSKESRLCYHGVPKILKASSDSWSYDNSDSLLNEEYKEVVNICKDISLWQPFNDYLSNSRINVNIRQVLKRGQKRLSLDCDENKL